MNSQFQTLKSHPLHLRAVKLFKLSNRIDHLLIVTLQKIEREKLHLRFGYRSLSQYCMQCIGMTEAQTGTYINVSRTCQQVPELQSAVESGAITVNKAVRIASIVKEKDVDTSFWIQQASTKSQKVIEAMVAEVRPELARVRECSKPLGNDRVLVVMSMDKKQHEAFLRVQDLESRSQRKNVSLEEAHMASVVAYLKVNDPLQKAERAQKRIEKKAAKETIPTAKQVRLVAPQTDKGSQAIPAAIRHQVNLRDKCRCQQRLPNGQICGATRFTDVHHIIPRAEGGTNALDNLITLCSGHHAAMHDGLIRSEFLKVACPRRFYNARELFVPKRREFMDLAGSASPAKAAGDRSEVVG